jgi:hypothetical protein
MRKLAIVAILGLGVATLSVVGIATMGVTGLADNFSSPWFDRAACTNTGATATSRSLAWDGGDAVTVQVPANIHYRRGEGTQLVVKGDPMILSHLKLRDGKISLNCSLHSWHGERIDITLPGRDIRNYTIAGLADLDLQQIKQDHLKIVITGKAKVNANGNVGDLNIEIAGRGDAFLRNLIANNVKILVAGRGNIETSPIDDADITIMGQGDVSLYTEPKHLDTAIMGKGNIRHMAEKS